MWKAIQNFIEDHGWKVELVIGFLLMISATTYLTIVVGIMMMGMGIWNYADRRKQ